MRTLVSARGAAERGVALLFAGDHGNLDISSAGKLQWGQSNFLVRSRHLFHEHAIATVLVDAPSDRKDSRGLYAFRSSPQHADDLAAVIGRIHRIFRAPLWLVGTSRGTESVANVARRFSTGGSVAGIVLTASLLRPEPIAADLPGCIFDVPLAEIRLRVLIAHHRDDACHLCPSSDLARLQHALAGADEVDVRVFEGGAAPQSDDPCRGLHWHGFFGIESGVIDAIAGWMQRPSRRPLP